MFVFGIPLKCLKYMQNHCLIKFGHVYDLQLSLYALIISFLIKVSQPR